jgi:hypothetical protein
VRRDARNAIAVRPMTPRNGRVGRATVGIPAAAVVPTLPPSQLPNVGRVPAPHHELIPADPELYVLSVCVPMDTPFL